MIDWLQHKRYVMQTPASIGIDLIRELRLRQWARTHYVPAQQRVTSWHPVVLDEMHRRDEELHASEAFGTSTQSGYVPLAPDTRFEFAEAS
jgi:hypothetical protein